MRKTRFISAEACGLKLRESDSGEQSGREIEGRPVVFGVRSVNLTPWNSTRKVYEILEPGCISRELLQKSDVVLNLNHDSDVVNVLGRFRNNPSRDTLRLELDDSGISCRCELPKTSNADDTLELIRRGDINGMSFAFMDDWEDSENGVSYERTDEIEDGKEVWLRHVKRITDLYDVSIVTFPAYEQTSVATREQSDAIDEAIESQIKREQDERGCKQNSDSQDGQDDPDDQGTQDNPENGYPDDSDDKKNRERARTAAQRRVRQRAHFLRDIEIENL